MNRLLRKAGCSALTFSFLVFLACGIFTTGALAKIQSESLELADGTKVRYQLITPDDYDATREYPAVLYFAGGGGNAKIVRRSVRGTWGKEAEARGYILIAPIVIGRKLYFRGGEVIFPEFLDRILDKHKIKGGKFHLFGISNGGISAMHVAALNPDHFSSVVTMPGYLKDATPARYGALDGMCLAFIAGEKDTSWAANARRDHAALTEMGRAPFLHIVADGGHVPDSYRGDNAGKIFDLIENGAGC